MTAEQIITLITSIASFLLVTLIPSLILLIQKWKAYKNAKTEEEKQKILNEITTACNQLIKDAEQTYKSVDNVLKSQGSKGCGAVKKEIVLSKIQALCLEKGIEYNQDYWSNKIEEIIDVTKNVNSKTN